LGSVLDLGLASAAVLSALASAASWSGVVRADVAAVIRAYFLAGT